MVVVYVVPGLASSEVFWGVGIISSQVFDIACMTLIIIIIIIIIYTFLFVFEVHFMYF